MGIRAPIQKYKDAWQNLPRATQDFCRERINRVVQVIAKTTREYTPFYRDSYKNDPQLLGSGQDKFVFKIPDTNLALAVFGKNKKGTSLSTLRAMHKAHVVAPNNTPKLVALVQEPGLQPALLVECITGYPLDKIPEDVQKTIVEHPEKFIQHFTELLEGLDKMFQVQVYIDGGADNIRYDPERGFVCLDIEKSNNDEYEKNSLLDAVDLIPDELLFLIKDLVPRRI